MPIFAALWRFVLGAPLTEVVRLDVPADRFEPLVVLARLCLLFKLFLRFAAVRWGAPAEGALLAGLARRGADGLDEFSVLELARLNLGSEPLAEVEESRDR